MLEFDIVKLLTVTAASIAFSVPAAVLIHELGHLAGGWLYKYRFTSITVMRIKLSFQKGRPSLRYIRNGPLGQCIMHPKTIRQKAGGLILGGILSNAVTGAAVLTGGAFVSNLYVMIICITLGSMNLIAAIMNWMSESVTNDGNTYREAGKDPRNTELYNRIMLIYHLLDQGTDYASLPDELLKEPLDNRSSLAAEIAMFRYYRAREKFSENKCSKAELFLEEEKLKRYPIELRGEVS